MNYDQILKELIIGVGMEAFRRDDEKELQAFEYGQEIGEALPGLMGLAETLKDGGGSRRDK